jgi:hypothetical protein
MPINHAPDTVSTLGLCFSVLRMVKEARPAAASDNVAHPNLIRSPYVIVEMKAKENPPSHPTCPFLFCVPDP